MRGGLILTGAGALVMVVAALAAHVPPPCPDAPDIVAADVALVLSGDVDYIRVAKAVALHRAGSVGWVLLTGSGVGGDSADTMARHAGEKLSMDTNRLLLERLSTSTRENVTFAIPLIRSHGFRRVALVTSEIHMRRAFATALKTAPDLEWIPVPVRDPGPSRRLVRVRLMEWAKLVGYRFRGWV